ncbi:hypothetical protein WT60_29005 [Burkholderia sp. MSMB617WGS]|nr:hypothetical protein WT60_29005 [Burkholderia sp. MSMB617WGS]KWZ48975.1 hypothetical protein WS73_11150 [Burkholderia savannae]
MRKPAFASAHAACLRYGRADRAPRPCGATHRVPPVDSVPHRNDAVPRAETRKTAKRLHIRASCDITRAACGPRAEAPPCFARDIVKPTSPASVHACGVRAECPARRRRS